jgi:hypothetical protein
MAAAFVQGKGNTGNEVSVRTIVAGSSISIGEVIWVCAAWFDDDGVTSMTAAVTDSAGNTYTSNTLRTKTGTAANNSRMQSFYTVNGTAAAHTITITLTGGPAFRLHVDAIVLSGVDTSTPLIAQNWGQTVGSSDSDINAGDLITTADGAILVSMVATSADRTYTTPTGYTRATATTTEDSNRAHAVYRAVGAADTYSCVHSWSSGSTNGLTVHDAFRATIVAAPATRVLNTLRTRTLNKGVN